MIKSYIYLIISVIYFASYYYIKIFNQTIYDYLYSIRYFDYWISYLNAFVWIFLSYSIIDIIWKKFENFINKDEKYSNTIYERIFWWLVKKFINISKYIIAIYIWIQLAIIPIKAEIFVDRAFSVSFIIAVLFLLNSFIVSIFDNVEVKENVWLNHQVFSMAKKVVIVWVWIIWIIMIISNLWYDITALIAWAWIWWLAIALAAQKSVANIFWAISVILNKPFKVWDFIKIGDNMWTAIDIWLSYLTIRTLEWHHILIPNENIISSNIQNITERENRFSELAIWLTYDTSLEKVKEAVKIVQDILASYTWENETDKLSSYRLHFDNFWDFSLNLTWNYFSRITDLNEFSAFKEEINLKIKEQFEKAWIEMAFPTQTIYMWNEDKKWK